ncbi:DUF1365 domain-containing protein [Hyphomicrobium sp. 99]|uniref:DUF1365 domain-containing protein n=1 Tax=Hyphomicrobium sp. 99 TaxID=1163419 RepID=UPI0005F7C054|nr:DUF1365 family protein [Hyphomicrobium sp. 99]
MTLSSALYSGSVVHRRVRPVLHLLRYRVFWLLLDLGEIDKLSKTLWLFSRNRFNALSFYDRDYGDGGQASLYAQIQEHLRKANVSADGKILLLSMPRILGYVFNPLSIYFCHDARGQLKAIVYEVHNTFGERHSYVIPVEGASGTINQRCEKAFYVSPFLGMDLRYAFSVVAPGERINVAIRGYDGSGLVIVTALSGSRRRLTDGALLAALLAFPFLTLKVMAAIHWHALRLYLKGLKVYNHGVATVVPRDLPARKSK